MVLSITSGYFQCRTKSMQKRKLYFSFIIAIIDKGDEFNF